MSVTTEQARILWAAKDGRLRKTEHGRYVIDGGLRPDRKTREKLIRNSWISPTYVGVVRITTEGEAALRVLEADEAS